MSLLIENTVEFVKNTLQDTESGHDWFHIERVWKLSRHIAAIENRGNLEIIELAALLHDIADSKFHNGDELIGGEKADSYLVSQNVDKCTRNDVKLIIDHISFKGGHSTRPENNIEFDIVQDADRLDALGAIGIARTFNYGGFKHRKIYDPTVKPDLEMTKEEYKNSTAPTINHFYEKLLKLKDLMNTKTGSQIAESRHQFMLQFLDQFYSEWNVRF
ncbi:MAG: HD domain-containing protein [Nonlabens sp.]